MIKVPAASDYVGFEPKSKGWNQTLFPLKHLFDLRDFVLSGYFHCALTSVRFMPALSEHNETVCTPKINNAESITKY